MGSPLLFGEDDMGRNKKRRIGGRIAERFIDRIGILLLILTLCGCAGEENKASDGDDPEGQIKEVHVIDAEATKTSETAEATEATKSSDATKDTDETEDTDGTEGEKKNSNDQKPSGNGIIKVAPELQYEDEKSENLAVLLQEQAGGQICRVVAGSIFGSGVLYELDDQYLYIATAKHVLEGSTDLVYLRFVNDQSVSSSQFWVSEELDLGFVKVPIEEIQGFADELYLADRGQEYFNDCKTGDSVSAIGAFSTAHAEAYEGKMEEPFIYVEQYDHYMMVANVFSAPGMSGGGLFDRKGHFLGILCGTSEDDRTAVIPDGEVFIAFSMMQSAY